MNDPEGLRAIANQLEAAISPDLKEPYTEFGIQVVGFLRQAAASAMDDNVIEAALNQMSAVSAGRPASFDFKTTQKQTAAFSSTLEKIKTDAILLRNRAIKEDGYDPESRLQFEWWSVRGALKDDYFLVNKNATTWEDATIRIAHVSGVSGKKAKPVTYTFETVEPGQTLKFDSVFISSERINNHIVAFLISIKGKNEPQFNVWRCHSSTGTWTGLAKGHRYYWEHINVPDSKRESIIRTLFPSHEPKPAPK